jgi:nucleoside-diphosphate kinase
MSETLVFLKPDAVVRRYVGARTLKIFLDNGIEFKAFRVFKPPKDFIASDHYGIHKGRFFYPWLIEYVTCGPIVAAIMEGSSVIEKVRTLLGATVPENALPDTIRGRYGIFGGINVAHASDSKETAIKELNLWNPLFKEEGFKNVDFRINDYVDNYINWPMIDSLHYRELSKKFATGALNEEEANRNFKNLLFKETDIKEEIIVSLSKVMVENCKLGR